MCLIVKTVCTSSACDLNKINKNKYNQFEKRDGSIFSNVIDGDKIITDEAQVHKLLIESLKLIQRDITRPMYEELTPIPFPNLKPVTKEEMKQILKIITRNKALAGDLVSDSILGEAHHIERTSEILRDLWCGLQIDKIHFKCRLIALNKKHPEMPQSDQFRPIVVSSLLMKILEARLVEPLKNSMMNRLHISQTGFVHGMDAHVNVHRLLTYLHNRRSRGLRSYLLFLDFSSAYNTVIHQKLFEILINKSILSPSEVQLLMAIYSRNSIELGDQTFQPNVGLAQGSIISPFLFNVYSESLLTSLESNGWKAQDLYAFADDHLTVNDSLNKLRQAISLVQTWGADNNIKLNPSKSGIVEISPKYQRCALEIGAMFQGIPVVDSYKYLGVWIDQKLTPRKHIEYLFGTKNGKKKGKINFLTQCLSPSFKSISFDYGINLWLTFIKPLFLPLTTEASISTQTEKEEIQTKLRISLKKFLRLPKNFSTYILSQVFPLDWRITSINGMQGPKDSQLRAST